MLFHVIVSVVSLLVGGAGGYLYGAKVKAKADAVAATFKADVKKL